MARRLLAWAAALLLAVPAGAAVMPLQEAGVVVRVDGDAFPQASVDTMLRFARLKQPQSTLQQVLDAMIVNRLLAGYGRSQLSAAQLFPNTGVAFARDVALDDQLVGLLRAVYGKELEQALAALPGGGIGALIVAQPALQPQQLAAVFGDSRRLQLLYQLQPPQQAAARAVPVLQYRLPAGSGGSISLFDLYRRQNVQGRMEFHNRNLAFIGQQARLYLGSLYLLEWAEARLGKAALAHLRRTLDDQDHVQAMLQYYGVGADMHYDSQYLKQLAASVTAPEIRSYYSAHRDEFRRIERVRARHIRLPDEASARRVYAELQQGGDFRQLARRHSLAADRRKGGDLGWIRHRANLDWLAQLAYAQEPGEPAPPVRMPAPPDAATPWEIVLVEQRIDGYQPPDSDSVRYAAAQAIAQAKAVAEFKSLRERLLRNARIEIGAGLNRAGAS